MTNAQGASQADLTTDRHPQPLTQFQRDTIELGGPIAAAEMALENPHDHAWWGPTPTPQTAIADRVGEAEWRLEHDRELEAG